MTQPFEAAICEVSVCSESAVLDERSANQKLESSLVNFRMARDSEANMESWLRPSGRAEVYAILTISSTESLHAARARTLG